MLLPAVEPAAQPPGRQQSLAEPAVTPGKQPTMIFDRDTRLGVDFDAALLAELGKLPPKPMRLPKGAGPAFLGGPKT